VQSLNLKLVGLYTYPNRLGKSIPEGALLRAKNIVIDADSVAQSRRGINRLTYGFSSITDRASKFFTYQSKLLARYTGDKLAYYNTSSGWTDYSSTYADPSSTARIRSAGASDNFYFTSSTGIKKLDAYNATVTAAGMYKGLDITGSLTGAGGFLEPDNQVAYRHLWTLKDANKNLIIGAPSQRAVVSNPAIGTAQDVSLSLTIPAGITTSHILQVYRSAPSGSESVTPSDDLQLVYEANPTSGEISAKSLTFTDQTPNSLRGATLYTSPSQEGLIQSNEQPPGAKDVAAFNGSLFFGDTTSKQRLTITILGVGGTSGVAVDDVVTIAGTAYTAKAAEAAASGQFKAYTTGTPAQNIADTATSLVRVINQYATNTTVYAYYLSSVDDLPGQILLEERGYGGSTFAATASAHGSAYSPTLPTSGTTVSSTNDAFANAVMYSKLQQPEAVPLVNIFRIGSASKAVLRLIPLRDSLFVLKEDGIWRILGESAGNFRVETVDTSTKLLAPESAVALNNQIYCLSDQGVVVVTETGVAVVSRPIEGDLLVLFGKNKTGVANYSFGIGYETDRKYILFTITEAGDTVATQAYVYNVFTEAWTRWDLSKTCGLVNPVDDKLYFGDAASNYSNIERKNFNHTDYVDQSDDFTLISFTGTTLTLSDVTTMQVGDMLYQSSSVNSVITAIDVLTSSVTVRDTLSGWTVGTITLYSAIETEIEWIPSTGGNPGIIKNFQEASIFLQDKSFTTLTLSFKTDISPAYEATSLTGNGVGSWGLFRWGQEIWGGQALDGPIRTYVPLEKCRGSELGVKMTGRLAFQKFALQGISIPFENGNYWVA
jgi:hypothetical protein